MIPGHRHHVLQNHHSLEPGPLLSLLSKSSCSTPVILCFRAALKTTTGD